MSGLHLPPSARNGAALHLPPGAEASPVDRPGPTEDELTELVTKVAEIDRTFVLELDAHSLLALFSAAHLALRHPALAGSATETAVVALTDHVAADIAASEGRRRRGARAAGPAAPPRAGPEGGPMIARLLERLRYWRLRRRVRARLEGRRP